jgi:hypothetical protein
MSACTNGAQKHACLEGDRIRLQALEELRVERFEFVGVWSIDVQQLAEGYGRPGRNEDGCVNSCKA